MPAIEPRPLPADSLLARLRGPECYRDAFCAEVPGRVTLAAFIAAFYGSGAFLPERLALHAIGRSGGRAEAAALAEARAGRFAAWTVEAREADQILLRDFRDFTCSWLQAEPRGQTTRLWFGSGLRHPERTVARALVPVHRWYARKLLAGAVRGLR